MMSKHSPHHLEKYTTQRKHLYKTLINTYLSIDQYKRCQWYIGRRSPVVRFSDARCEFRRISPGQPSCKPPRFSGGKAWNSVQSTQKICSGHIIIIENRKKQVVPSNKVQFSVYEPGRNFIGFEAMTRFSFVVQVTTYSDLNLNSALFKNCEKFSLGRF